MATEGPIRVLVCDDSESFRTLMRATLPDADLEVAGEAIDGRQCVDRVLDTCADAVLLDLAMPTADGLSAILVLRERTPWCAIVVFSGFASAAMAERCAELGAHDYVEKGAPLDEVRNAVRAAVARQRASLTMTGA